ncbi:hypothetical protein LP420_14715 [Massilia sp. B-10]|nr:hypothetical protein LP420_14715 [Massilia sp. B-10]
MNFITAHDGFTLKDLYSCNSKNNLQAWPYGPSDGGEDNNNSWDQGSVAADQRKAARNGLALMMLSGYVPMIVGGDEMLRSINCNNNPYNLDSSANWLNWTLSTDQTNFKTFSTRMIAFRKAHPALRPLNFYSSGDSNGNVMEQLRWFKPDGGVADATYFNNAANHALAWRIDWHRVWRHRLQGSMWRTTPGARRSTSHCHGPARAKAGIALPTHATGPRAHHKCAHQAPKMRSAANMPCTASADAAHWY